MPLSLSAMVLVAIAVSGTPSHSGPAAAFVRALASPDRGAMVALTGTLDGHAMHSVRDVMERFNAIQVESHAVIDETSNRIVVALDATGIPVSGSRDRRPLPRRWVLFIDPVTGRLTNARTEAQDLLHREGDLSLHATSSETLQDAAWMLNDARLCARLGDCRARAEALLAEAIRRSDFETATRAATALARLSTGDEATAALARARFWAERARSIDATIAVSLAAAQFEPSNAAREELYAGIGACAEQLQDARLGLHALWEQGTLAFRRFDIAATLTISEDLEARARKGGWPRGEMLGLYGKARVAGSRADYDTLQRHILFAVDVAESIGDREWEARAYNIYAMSLLRQGRSEDGRRILERALSITPPEAEEVQSILHTLMASVLQSHGKLAEVSAHLEVALRTGRASRSSFLAATLSAAAQLARDHGRYAEAIELHREAIREQGEDVLWLVWVDKVRLADVLVRCGDEDAAIEELFEAVDLVEARRALAKSGDVTWSRYFSEHVRVYDVLIEALVSRNRFEEALIVAERIRARVLAESARIDTPSPLTSAEAEELRHNNRRLMKLNMEAGRATDDARLRIRGEIREVRREAESLEAQISMREGGSHALSHGSHLFDTPLPSGAAAVEFVVTEQSVIAFVVRDADVQAVRLPAAREAIRSQVRRYAAALAGRDAGYAREARALYDQLMVPLRDQLRDVAMLVVIPDGFLWDVPFEALVAPGGAFVGHDFAVEYRPSLRDLRGRGGERDRGHGDRELLVFANPDIDRVAADLPEASIEAQSISRFYPAGRSALRSGRGATESAFKETASRYRVIHFATHGLAAGGAPLHSSLLLSRDVAEDGVLEAREIARMKLNAQVVVLAACETAGSDVVRGEGLLGLSWAFLAAGARATVVSQWAVDSAATRQLMVHFHRRLAAGDSAPQALREAQRAVAATDEYSHPYYWASFVVIGDGRSAPPSPSPRTVQRSASRGLPRRPH